MVTPGLMQCLTYWPSELKLMQHSAFFKLNWLSSTAKILIGCISWLTCQSKIIISASYFGQILVQSGWSTVALVIIMYSSQTVWCYVFIQKQLNVSLLIKTLLSTYISLKFTFKLFHSLGNFSRQHIDDTLFIFIFSIRKDLSAEGWRLALLVKKSPYNLIKYFFFNFFPENKNLIFETNKKNIINLSSVDLAQRVVKIAVHWYSWNTLKDMHDWQSI